VVHLAGALGSPVWALVPSAPEWRYLAKGTRMPWYPSVRVFRQLHEGNWQPVIRDVVREARTMADVPGHIDSGINRGIGA
jgi:hypothetical protein